MDQQQSLNALLSELYRYDIDIFVFEDLIQKFGLKAMDGKPALIPFKDSHDLHNAIDCLISVGGDGTVLDAITLVGATRSQPARSTP